MSYLSQVTKGRLAYPDIVLAYGPDGVGKSSFLASAPSPIVCGPESGSFNLDIARLPEPESYDVIMAQLNELLKTDHEFKTLGLDSIDWIEPLVWEKVCSLDGSSSIDDAQKGWGRGYAKALDYWKEMMDLLKSLRDQKKMNIIVIGHCHVKAFNDPQQATSYDRFQLKLNDKAAALWREFVDGVFFLNFETFTKTDDRKKVRAFSDGTRLIHTHRTASFDAKNRFGLPETIPFDHDNGWQKFQQAKLTSNPDSPEVIIKQITGLLESVGEKEIKDKVTVAVSNAKGNKETLLRIKNKLEEMVED